MFIFWSYFFSTLYVCPESLLKDVFCTISDSSSSTGSDTKVTARKVGESVTTALDVMATAINYPIGKLLSSPTHPVTMAKDTT